MLKRDFIMVQIEELAKVILHLIGLRTTDNPSRQSALINEVYSSLKTDRQYLLQTSSQNICEMMSEGGNSGLLRMEIAAKALIEDSFTTVEEKEQLLLKAQQLLEYIQMHDNTFSLDRLDTLQEIKNLLAEKKL